MSEKKMRRALGRGLSSLIPEQSAGNSSGQEVVLVPAGEIRPNPFQPRTDFNEEEINGLAESIKNQGLLQPVLVRKTTAGYDIISGERRFRALKQLGETGIPCIVRDKVSDREMQEIALVENLQRENLNEIEKAHAYERLLLDFGLSHEDLSHRVGASRSAVTNTLRMLKLPAKIQEMLRAGRISSGHARALLSIESAERQISLAEKIESEGLSVRSIEAFTQKRSGKLNKNTETNNPPQDADTIKIIERLRYKFGTPVKIKQDEKGAGFIDVQFFSPDDLNRILDILLK
jgi:ParB family chromosome partitioning protein